MKIELHEISVREVADKYTDNDEDGIFGYGGKLNIRPKYQREFVYNDDKRNEVIKSVSKDFPINVMYWVKNEDGTYEMLDGQQRTISLCKYVAGDFSLNSRAFHNLTKVEQEQILNYKLMIYFCEGDDKEKLDWFKTINIAGEKLTDQELRNAIYTGEWLTEAKKHFSKTGCPAYSIADKYVNGSTIRQDYLETAIKWIADRESISIEDYMSIHQHDTNCSELWLYFQSVINWIKTLFPNYRKEMKGLSWGVFYNKYKDNQYDPKQLEKKIKQLMIDDDVTKKPGIYAYLLSKDEKHLSIRAFTGKMKTSAYEKQNGICAKCGEHFEINEMEADHITPWCEGGKTIPENCQMLCKSCNRRKSNK